MELKLKPYNKSVYPLMAILIRSGSLEHWLTEIRRMNLSLDDFTAFPLAGSNPNVLWGCLLKLNKAIPNVDIGSNTFCQVIHENFIIPVYSTPYPQLTSHEINQIFKDRPHFLHPEIGLIELEEPINWTLLLDQPFESNVFFIQPKQGIFIPSKIRSYQINELPPEEVLMRMEKEKFPQRKALPDKPLNVLEKIKFSVLKIFFRRKKGKKGELEVTEKSSFAQKLQALVGGNKENNWMDRLQLSYEELEKRNQKEFDKLMNLFLNNPEEALKYAIPLDPNSTSRGKDTEAFSVYRMRNNLDLSRYSSSRGGGSVINNEYFDRLNQQYHQTAEEMIKNGKFDKAAFIYLKLLKSPVLAAQALENGKLYSEAAAIYLKELNNKSKAAECYEQARMTEKAIELYKELSEFEKVGDLYLKLGKRKEALQYYKLVVDEYVRRGQFVKAAVLSRYKMDDVLSSQGILLDGWRNNKDGINCLNMYFSNMNDWKVLENSIQSIYEKEVTNSNMENFIVVLSNQLDRNAQIDLLSTELAYRLISERAAVNPSIVSMIRKFNKSDKRLTRDIIRYKTKIKTGKST